MGVEHPDLLAGRLSRDALLAERGDNEVGEADGGGTGAEEEDPLVLELAAGDLERIDQSGEHDSRRALDIVVVARNLVAIARQQRDGISSSPVLEMDAAIWKHFLNRIHKCVDEGVEFFRRRTPLA